MRLFVVYHFDRYGDGVDISRVLLDLKVGVVPFDSRVVPFDSTGLVSRPNIISSDSTPKIGVTYNYSGVEKYCSHLGFTPLI